MKVQKHDLLVGELFAEADGQRIPLSPPAEVPGRRDLYPVVGLLEFLEGQEEGEVSLEIDGERLFGKRDEAKVRVMGVGRFRKLSGKEPVRGMEVHLETSSGESLVGRITSVSGGRVIIDFNHPFASKKVKVTGRISKILRSTTEKLSEIFGQEVTGNPPKVSLKYSPKDARVLFLPLFIAFANLVVTDPFLVEVLSEKSAEGTESA